MSAYDDLEFTQVDVPPILAAQVRSECSSDPIAIAGAMGPAFGAVMRYVGQHGLSMAGPPRAIYEAVDAQKTQFVVAVPIDVSPAGEIQGEAAFAGGLPGCKALRFTHRGPYRELPKTYGRITEFMKSTGRMTSEADWNRYMPMWEEYLNDPETTPEAELLTYIYLPTE
jgi:effector-binding domain-containing protein